MTLRWMPLAVLLVTTLASAQTTFTRPGSFAPVEFTGEVTVVSGNESRPLDLKDRLRGEATLRTGPRSTARFELSNGTELQLGSESELTVVEYWQQPHLLPGKVAEMPQEPSPSRTVLRLVSGDVRIHVRPLLVARGSSLSLELLAGTARVAEGTLRARIRMTELGLGLCSVEVQGANGEFEVATGKTVPLRASTPLEFAVELDPVSGAVRLSDFPKPEPRPGSGARPQ